MQYFIVGFVFAVIYIVCVKALARHVNNPRAEPFKGFLGYLEERAEDVNCGDDAGLLITAALVWCLWPIAWLVLALAAVIWFVGHVFNV